MSEAWRLFIAIELPAEIVTYLTEIQSWLRERAPRRAVRWVQPDSIHLTLKFLGDVPVDYRKSLQDALAESVNGHAPFELSAGELGCFPNMRRPRVAWVGVHSDLKALHALRDAVETHIAPLGYPTEKRPYHPHLTLGRVRREADHRDIQALGELIARADFKEHRQWSVSHVTLFRSELSPQGAIYTPLARAALETSS